MTLQPKTATIACAREADVRPGTVIPPGVQPSRCMGCGCRVLVSESSRRLAQARKAQIACPACANAMKGSFTHVLLPEGGVQEMAAWEDQERPKFSTEEQ